MACGLPVVGTNGGGVAELVDRRDRHPGQAEQRRQPGRRDRGDLPATWRAWAGRAAQGGRGLRLERDPAPGAGPLRRPAGRHERRRQSRSVSVSPTDSLDAAAAPMLCVSIHDVAPATWSDCLRLVQAMREVADIPLTWLVVPHYHFRPERSPAMEAGLDVVPRARRRAGAARLQPPRYGSQAAAACAALPAQCLHPPRGRVRGPDEAEARRRLDLGPGLVRRARLDAGRLRAAGLAAGRGRLARAARIGFAYTTTFSHFHCLGGRAAPCCRPRWCIRRATAAAACCRRAWPTPPPPCWRMRRWCASACTRRMRATPNWYATPSACWNACWPSAKR
jgi:hypothetical protein